MASKYPPREDIGHDQPLRLAVAAALAFPDGSMTASGLRREAARGRLVIERIAGKDYTTLGQYRGNEGAMPRRSKGPRLWLRECPARSRPAGSPMPPCGSSRTANTAKARDAAQMIVDELRRRSPATSDASTSPHAEAGVRPPAHIPVADVIALYGRDVAPKHSRPRETAQRIAALLGFFGDKVLSDINGTLCRAYVEHRGSIAAARRELEDLRAAINHHRKEGLCSAIVEVVLPRGCAGARALAHAGRGGARCLWAAWRYREVQKGKPTGRRSRQHVARFILLALYTGTRAGAVCGAALQPTIGRGWIDVARGVFYRRADGERETKKRKPPVPLPPELLRPSAALETAGPAVRRRMVRRASHARSTRHFGRWRRMRGSART